MGISDGSSDVCVSDLVLAGMVWALHLEAGGVVHLVGLDDAGFGVLQRPHHTRQHGGADLQAGGVLVGRQLAGLADRELRAVPVARKSVVWGRRVSVPVDLGERRTIKNKKRQ